MQGIMKKRLRLTKNQKGMTLIELMAVVVILGILAAIAGVAVINAVKTSEAKSDQATIRMLKDAGERWVMDNGIPTADKSLALATDLKDYISDTSVTPAQKGKTGWSITVTKDTGVVTVTTTP